MKKKLIKGTLKRGIVSTLGLALIVGTSMYAIKPAKIDVEACIQVEEGSGIEKWIKGYLVQDYSICDTLSLDSTKLSSFYYSDEVYTSSISSSLYKALLKKSSESIVSITQVSGSGFKANIEVKYKPYRQINSFKLDQDSYKKVYDDYLSEDINQSEYESAINNLVLADFNQCFTLEDTECSVICSLTEESGKVSGTSGFTAQLFKSQGLLSIIEIYEKDFKKQIIKYTDEYLT